MRGQSAESAAESSVANLPLPMHMRDRHGVCAGELSLREALIDIVETAFSLRAMQGVVGFAIQTGAAILEAR